jgi:hypothetical protein
VRDALAVVPKGQRLLGAIDGESDMGGPSLSYPQYWDALPGGFAGPWGDNVTATVSARWTKWLTEYKRIGGELDVMHVDAEWEGWFFGTSAKENFAGQRSAVSNRTGVWSAIAADPRWPKLQARLNAAGKPYGQDFGDISGMGSWPLNSTTDLRAHVWDQVMYERTAEIVNASYFQPARQLFPDVKCSNYGHMYRPPDTHWPFMTGSNAAHPPFTGKGAHAGTHQAKAFYTPSTVMADSCTLEVSTHAMPMAFCWTRGTPFWAQRMVTSPLEFAVLLWSATLVRGMVVANPHVPVMPWLEPKDSIIYPAGGSVLAHSDMYQEMVLHMTLVGVHEFLFWHPGPARCCWVGWIHEDLGSCTKNTCTGTTSNITESITVGVSALNAVLAEADEVIGVVEQTPLLLDVPNTWDPYLLSGVEDRQNQRRVYRFTPRSAATVLKQSPATFTIAGVPGEVVPVPNGELHGVVDQCSNAGFWIVVPASARQQAAMKLDDGDAPARQAPPHPHLKYMAMYGYEPAAQVGFVNLGTTCPSNKSDPTGTKTKRWGWEQWGIPSLYDLSLHLTNDRCRRAGNCSMVDRGIFNDSVKQHGWPVGTSFNPWWEELLERVVATEVRPEYGPTRTYRGIFLGAQARGCMS